MDLQYAGHAVFAQQQQLALLGSDELLQVDLPQPAAQISLLCQRNLGSGNYVPKNA